MFLKKEWVSGGSMWIDSIVRTTEKNGDVETFDVEVWGEIHKYRVFEHCPMGLTFQDLTRGEQLRIQYTKMPKIKKLVWWFREIDGMEDMFFHRYGKKIED